MYPEKGSIQEVMGLPPRSVTKPGKPKHMKIAYVAFQQQKSQLESHGQMWLADVYCLVDRIFFCNLNLSVLAGRVLFSKATSFSFLAPFTPLCCLPGLCGHSCSPPSLPPPAPPLTPHPLFSYLPVSAKYTVLFLMQRRQALNLCLYEIIHKGTIKLPCPQIDSLMNMSAQGQFAYCSVLQVRDPLQMKQ